MESNIEWKNSKVLKVTGVTVRPGTYTSQGGVTVPFTRELCQKIFSESPTLTPSYLTHEDRDTCGYFYKLGYNKDEDTIHYEGFVFDPMKQKQILSDGFNAISPEIDFVKDSAGNFVGGIVTGNAFVRNPAINGTKVDASFVAFSAPLSEQLEQSNISDEDKKNVYSHVEAQFNKQKDGNVMVNYTMKSNPDGTYAFIPTSEPVVQNFSVEDVAKIKADHAVEIATMKAKIESFEAQAVAPVQVPAVMPITATITEPVAAPVAPVNDEYKNKYEALLNEKANTLVGELRGIGLKEPDKIGAGLTAEQRINVLTSVKENVLKTSPVTTAAVPIVTPAPVSTSESKMAELMKANGIGDQFKKYLQPKVS